MMICKLKTSSSCSKLQREIIITSSRSRSPPRRERIVEREEKRARSYSRRPVPKRATTPPSKTRKHSPTPEEEDIVREG